MSSSWNKRNVYIRDEVLTKLPIADEPATISGSKHDFHRTGCGQVWLSGIWIRFSHK